MSSSLEKEVLRYSKKNGYPISTFSDVTCKCGNTTFELYSDDDEGGALLICPECGVEHDLENSRGYMLEAQQNICTCDNERLSIGIGRAFYNSSNDVRWVYVGGHCLKCNLAGVYVDWKQP